MSQYKSVNNLKDRDIIFIFEEYIYEGKTKAVLLKNYLLAFLFLSKPLLINLTLVFLLYGNQ